MRAPRDSASRFDSAISVRRREQGATARSPRLRQRTAFRASLTRRTCRTPPSTCRSARAQSAPARTVAEPPSAARMARGRAGAVPARPGALWTCTALGRSTTTTSAGPEPHTGFRCRTDPPLSDADHTFPSRCASDVPAAVRLRPPGGATGASRRVRQRVPGCASRRSGLQQRDRPVQQRPAQAWIGHYFPERRTGPDPPPHSQATVTPRPAGAGAPVEVQEGPSARLRVRRVREPGPRPAGRPVATDEAAQRQHGTSDRAVRPARPGPRTRSTTAVKRQTGGRSGADPLLVDAGPRRRAGLRRSARPTRRSGLRRGAPRPAAGRRAG